jgi:hypothetical protein
MDKEKMGSLGEGLMLAIFVTVKPFFLEGVIIGN